MFNNKDIKELQSTLKQACSCLNGVSFRETRCGGVAQKGKRKLAVTVSDKAEKHKFKIVKGRRGGFFSPINRLDTMAYYDIKNQLEKALNTKNKRRGDNK